MLFDKFSIFNIPNKLIIRFMIIELSTINFYLKLKLINLINFKNHIIEMKEL